MARDVNCSLRPFAVGHAYVEAGDVDFVAVEHIYKLVIT